MKKIYLLLCFVLFLALCTVPALAVDADLSHETAVPGEEITFTVTLSEEVSDIVYGGITFTYDESALEYVTGEWNVGDARYAVFPLSGRDAAFLSDSGKTVAVEGKLCTITFKVKDSAAVGTYNVGIEQLTFQDSNEENITATVTDGTVTVAEPLYWNPGEAFPAYEEGDTVVLTGDITLTEAVAISKSVKIDGRGYSVFAGADGIELFKVSKGTAAVKVILKNTVIDGLNRNVRAIRTETATSGLKINVELQNTTIQNCKVTGNINGNDNGAAVYIAAYGSVSVIDGVTITSCSAKDSGGAVYVANNGVINMSGGSITNCSSGVYGGAVAGITAMKNYIFTGGTISGCSAESGGAIYSSKAFELEGITLSGNSATEYGGAVYKGGTTGNVTLISGSLTGNTAGISGGAVYNGGSGALILTAGAITGNTAVESGGGVWTKRIEITDASITENIAAQGGGVWLEGTGDFTVNGELATINNNYMNAEKTVENNVELQEGQSIYFENDHSGDIGIYVSVDMADNISTVEPIGFTDGGTVGVSLDNSSIFALIDEDTNVFFESNESTIAEYTLLGETYTVFNLDKFILPGTVGESKSDNANAKFVGYSIGETQYLPGDVADVSAGELKENYLELETIAGTSVKIPAAGEKGGIRFVTRIGYGDSFTYTDVLPGAVISAVFSTDIKSGDAGTATYYVSGQSASYSGKKFWVESQHGTLAATDDVYSVSMVMSEQYYDRVIYFRGCAKVTWAGQEVIVYSNYSAPATEPSSLDYTANKDHHLRSVRFVVQNYCTNTLAAGVADGKLTFADGVFKSGETVIITAQQYAQLLTMGNYSSFDGATKTWIPKA